MTFNIQRRFIAFVFFAGVFLCGAAVRAQTTAFTYQGKLTDNTAAATGTYQMQFSLFDAAGDGTQIGATIANPTVNVSNGIFTVNLDFGAAAFPGANRFLQISVFSTTTNAFVALNPRQSVASAPYAVRSLNAATADAATNAANLGNVPANQFVQTTDPRLSDSRDPLAGSGNYIQNQSGAAQMSANFNISGGGTSGGTLSGNTVNSATQYNLGGNRVLSVAGTANTFAGVNAGAANTSGSNNAFFGRDAGAANLTGGGNSFFGSRTGEANTTGDNNSVFGFFAGINNTTGVNNAFFGNNAGVANLSGNSNAFFGATAGATNTIGINNAFVGAGAGLGNTNGGSNVFIGFLSGNTNTTGDNNTAIGNNANVASNNLDHAAAIGADATVSTSSTIVLGRANGADKVRVPGLGAAGGTSLCRNANNEISTCTAGNFSENGGGGGSVILDALRAQNARMQNQLAQQQTVIDRLKKAVCQINPQTEICREGK